MGDEKLEVMESRARHEQLPAADVELGRGGSAHQPAVAESILQKDMQLQQQEAGEESRKLQLVKDGGGAPAARSAHVRRVSTAESMKSAVSTFIYNISGPLDREDSTRSGISAQGSIRIPSTGNISMISERLYNAYISFQEDAQNIVGVWKILMSAYQSLGVVYGDLGASPLYVFPAIRQLESPDEKDLLGIMSLVFWTLTLVGLIKYVLIVLLADDHGEGGTLALYSLLCQHAKIGGSVGKQYSYLESDMNLIYLAHPTQSTASMSFHFKVKIFLENSRIAQRALLITIMVGTCMVIGDGALTPAISVLSAISGLRVSQPSIDKNLIVVISCIILVGLFLVQSLGTSKMSFLFSPIMVLWFLTTPIIGLYNIIKYYPGVFKSLSPHYAFLFFSRNDTVGWKGLGAISLCVSGAEVMFADMGHFNRRSIQVAFSLFVYPSLILTYAGIIAYLIKHPQELHEGFYKSIPTPVYWPMFVIATLAAIVASQALISATFSIIKSAIALGCFPRVKLIHTSPSHAGHVYSPEVNYILMVFCVVVVIVFQDGEQIGNAFGVALMFVMIITTLLVAVVMLVVWNTSLSLILIFLAIFGLIEGFYLTAVLNKIRSGGWLPIVVSAILLSIMLCWNHGRQIKYEFESQNKMGSEELGDLIVSSGVMRVPGLCFFYSDLVFGLPPIIGHYVRNVNALHNVIIMMTIRCIPVKTVLPRERFVVSSGKLRGLYRCVARYGYMDTVSMEGNDFMDQVVQSIVEYLRSKYDIDSRHMQGEHADVEFHDRLQNRWMYEELLHELEMAREKPPVHVVGQRSLKTGKNTSWFESIAIDKLYFLLQNTSRSAMASFELPSSNLLQVGMVYELQ
ncbi:hypothetical protein O6H91_04G046900 [Diphasiastrum complanatum]|uniref:Uncharacterized protein n=1 Tax=Diphasiastrum complanatum TaxID=34168 RepID=A0ACC2DWQ3_DIPCM|nr:hypothetical protein O6H91_04G046900 [Diphasiastrum complanatum]